MKDNKLLPESDLTGLKSDGCLSALPSFKIWLFQDTWNRKCLMFSAIAIIIQFSWFKYMYPYAGFIDADSYSYLDAASHNLDINTYMIGYSKFLRLFSVFTHSDTALVAFQFFFLQASMLFLLFTLFYFYNPRKITRIILLCIMVVNPLFLYLSNYISSDSLFLALSLIWFSLLLWILHRSNLRLIIWHTLIIFIAFTFRYNALIYPCISVLAFCISRQSIRNKIMGIVSFALIIGLFVISTAYSYKSLTGYWQYSPFSGWQIANNAMYAYRYVDPAQMKPVPVKYKVLDKMIRTYFDTSRNVFTHPYEMLIASTNYMWDIYHSPLYKYRELQFAKDTGATEMKKWASMGPFYADYGLYIIKQYPFHYFKHFIWPNANKYYSLPLEFLETYNSGVDRVAPIAKDWFQYKSRKVFTRFEDFSVRALVYYPILSGIMNIILLCTLLCFVILQDFRLNTKFRKAILLAASLWLINAGFTIFASSAALRFQSFPLMLTIVFSFLLIDWLWKMAIATESNKSEKGQQTIREIKSHLS